MLGSLDPWPGWHCGTWRTSRARGSATPAASTAAPAGRSRRTRSSPPAATPWSPDSRPTTTRPRSSEPGWRPRPARPRRSVPSTTGLLMLLPSVAGLSMQKEISVLSDLIEREIRRQPFPDRDGEVAQIIHRGDTDQGRRCSAYTAARTRNENTRRSAAVRPALEKSNACTSS